MASPRATATRWRMPPESSRGPLPPGRREVDEGDELLGEPRALPRGQARVHGVDGEGHVVEDAHPGQQRVLLEDDAALGPGLRHGRAVEDDARRASGAMSPPIRDTSVVLPEPE